jgi:transglutaminase-like putative cysteine protease
MKKVFTLTALLIFVIVISTVAFADGGSVFKVNSELGTVSVNYNAADYSDLKVLVKKGTEQYVYNLYDSQEEFALQMGNGQYTFGLYQRVQGNKYRKITATSAYVTVEEMTVYTATVQNIAWSEDSEAVILAKELTAEAKTDREKFEAVYDYVINNMSYDYQKAATVGSRYIPNNTAMLESNKGICYDYSSLMASMLRSLEIPTKLVEGHSTYTSVYHAWNEVFIDGEWITVDTTVDAQLANRNIEYAIEKSTADYAAAKSF